MSSLQPYMRPEKEYILPEYIVSAEQAASKIIELSEKLGAWDGHPRFLYIIGASIFGIIAQNIWQTILQNRNIEGLAYLISAKLNTWLPCIFSLLAS